MDRLGKNNVPVHSKQWTTFFEKKILHDPTHKEIERQENLLADNYEKKLLSCASTSEDIRHFKTRKSIDKDEKQVRREGYGVREYLLEPLRRVTCFSTGYYDDRTTPANNMLSCRRKMNRKPTRNSWQYHGVSPAVEWCDEISEEQKESLESCLQVHSMTINQNTGQKE